MKKYLLIFLLLSSSAQAADFVSVHKIQDTWSYEFKFHKGISHFYATDTLSVSEYDCHTPTSKVTGLPIFESPTNCFQNETDARKDAQKQADLFEKNHQ